MKIEHRTHPDYDLVLATELAALEAAEIAVDSPHLEPRGAQFWLGSLVYGWDMLGVPHVFVARDDAGTALGFARLEMPLLDNTQLLGIDLTTGPEVRNQGVGDALLDQILTLAREVDRPQIVAGAWRDSHRARFWERHGYPVASAAAQRRLVPADLDWPALDELHADSLKNSADYDILEIPSPVPAEHIEGVLELQRTMNDAPLDDLQIEDMVWPEQRYRDHEEAMRIRGIRQVRLVARRRGDGAYGGFTVVAIEDDRPHLGFQEDTAVVAAHRGHRLGLRMKIEMLRLLRDRHPQLARVDTWNAESNSYMISVNDALGCFVVGRVVEFQRRLE